MIFNFSSFERVLKRNETERRMYVTPKKAGEFHCVTNSTLIRWAKEGKIRHLKTGGGQYRYWIDPTETPMEYPIENSLTPCRVAFIYARVSSSSQRDDLDRQIKHLAESYPTAKISSDIGSGLNFNRKGLQSILEKINMGTVSSVIISHKDRVSRFGFEWFEYICKSNDTELVILNDKNKSFKSSRDELVEDLLAVTHSFSSKMYSNRKYTGGSGVPIKGAGNPCKSKCGSIKEGSE